MSTYRIDSMRERNKHLFGREKLERMSGCSLSRSRGREDEDAEEQRPEVMVTLPEGDQVPARAALLKPSVRFTDKQQMHQCSTRHDSYSHSAEPTTLSDNLRHPRDNFILQDTRPLRICSSKVMHSKVQKDVRQGDGVQSGEFENQPVSDRRHVQPLLGYDWIAGVLDAEDSLLERSDEFFEDLRTFRSINKDECVHPGPVESFEESRLFPPLLRDEDDKEANTDTHQCTFSYRINYRLFPVPLSSEECCPVCKKPKSSHPENEPALIRVSIPRSNLLPPYKYKAHRRSSFDPSDSLGLPSHCLSGWSNAGQDILPPPSSLDLRSSIRRNLDGSLSQELQDLSSPRRDQEPEQIPDVRRLARFNFQHFSPKRKPRDLSFPLGY
ncbi:migration and invasion-inhibitory protein isoform X1 [Cyprinodon tularosa]|uniref:migration and invasion-inhibitory protein isoform X1 n=2 Tax=Cyprinodon tularosa TaxID=77115 RepID=UPI0018E27B74|nr:migration and invasion-inhibitory protein isoform X1 [Cyprinodon tularosa]